MLNRASGWSGKRRLVTAGLSSLGLIALVAVLAVAVLALNTRTAFGSGTGGGGCFSTTGPTCTFKGMSANIDFSTLSPDGCVVTDAFAGPFQNLTAPGHVATQAVMLDVSQYNICTGTLIYGMSNFDPNTQMPVFNGTFQADQKLSSATLNGTAPMYDFNTGALVYTVSVNLTWKGYGPTSSFMDINSFRGPGFFVKNHFRGESRNATTDGTFTDPSGANLAFPTPYGFLSNSSGGTTQLSHK
ncbi:MAG TPA: hypothetical protein VF808_04665 [Ktedonobacterales bacterium]